MFTQKKVIKTKSMHEITISIAGTTDITDLNLVNKEHRKVKPIYLDVSDFEDYDLQSDKKIIFKAEKENEIIGYLYIYCDASLESDNEAGFNIVVKPIYRRQKVGETILQYVIKYIKEKTNVQRLKAGIKTGNEGSKNLCAKYGFQMNGRNSTGFTMILKLN